MADGLFSYKTPGQLQQDYLGGLMQPVGGGNLYNQLVQTMSNAGRIAGYGAGRMFGGQVPGEAKNAAIQSVFEQVKDIQDPTQQYTAASQLFLKAGFPDLAAQARKTAQTEQLTGYQLKKAKFEADEITDAPQRMRAALEAKFPTLDENQIKAVANNKELFKIYMTPTKPGQTEIKKVGVAEGTQKPVYVFKQDGNISQVVAETDAQGRQSFVPYSGAVDQTTAKQTVSVGDKGLSAYASEVGKITAAQDIELISGANKAPAAVRKLRETIDLLHKSDDELTTGIGAELINALNKARAKFLKDEKAGKNVENTEYLRALLGSDVFPLIGALGIGARGLDTPAERDFLLDVMAGRIGLDKGTLIRMTNDRLRAAEEGVSAFNSKLDVGDFNQYQNVTKRKLNKIILPEWTNPVPGEKTPQPETTSGWSIKKKG